MNETNKQKIKPKTSPPKDKNQTRVQFFFFLTQKMNTAPEKKAPHRLFVDINDDEKKNRPNPKIRRVFEEIMQSPRGELIETKTHLVNLKENARLDA